MELTLEGSPNENHMGRHTLKGLPPFQGHGGAEGPQIPLEALSPVWPLEQQLIRISEWFLPGNLQQHGGRGAGVVSRSFRPPGSCSHRSARALCCGRRGPLQASKAASPAAASCSLASLPSDVKMEMQGCTPCPPVWKVSWSPPGSSVVRKAWQLVAGCS